jgi:hypothetical protein
MRNRPEQAITVAFDFLDDHVIVAELYYHQPNLLLQDFCFIKWVLFASSDRVADWPLFLFLFLPIPSALLFEPIMHT